MGSVHPIKDIIKLQKVGVHKGICSICSANKYVIKAAMVSVFEKNGYVLIESTANQVNQYGGYTGMTPAGFRDFVLSVAEVTGFPQEKVILGGDHLGPLVWKAEDANEAMNKAMELVKQYVSAGFTKIHLDTSMKLGGDSTSLPLDPFIAAQRGAKLCSAAEDAFTKLQKINPAALHPVYVIGSEVPVPGGVQEDEGLKVTEAGDFVKTVELFRKAFADIGLNDAWENVIAVVVQPGVEFGDSMIHDYDRNAARELCGALKSYPPLVFEGHSTDYQKRSALKEMVEDGIAILKVGPGLTYALREGLFLLNHMENELLGHRTDVRLSNFIDTLDAAMLKDPLNWNKYYHGMEEERKIARKYSFSDRCRYYLAVPEVDKSIQLLIDNLKSIDLNMSIISQYFPDQYRKIREGRLKKDAEDLLIDRVIGVIEDYNFAISTTA
ncbi:MAG: tagatose-bisphosphate aldolase [Ruminiclostridium sp.]|nr:tagatose-bisphosphate aldolase [Ruminiclostridium sp.]